MAAPLQWPAAASTASVTTTGSVTGAHGPTISDSLQHSHASREPANGLQSVRQKTISSPLTSPASSRGHHHQPHQPSPITQAAPSLSVRKPNPAKKVVRGNDDELHQAITREAVTEEQRSIGQVQSPHQQQQQQQQETPPKLDPAHQTFLRSAPTIMSNPQAAIRPAPHDRIPMMAQRTASIDSTVSSVSSMSNHRPINSGTTNAFRVSQESQGPQDAAALIAAAGSAEAALQKVLQEKQQAASHNAQLWRLVEKQRSMILGLNKDLEKSLKEKERYRRKLKDHISQSTPAPTLTPTDAPTVQGHSRETSESLSPLTPIPAPVRDISVDTLQTSDGSGSASNSIGRSDTPQDAINSHLMNQAGVASSPTGIQQTIHHDARPAAIDTRAAALATVQRTPTGTPPMSPKSAETVHSPKNSISHSKNHSTSSYHSSPPASATGNFSPKTRKAPPAPLRLDPPTTRPDPSVNDDVEDASDSEYEEDPESARSEFADRGRRKTREDDDREREVLAQKEAEQRSMSKKDKKSKSRAAEESSVVAQPGAAEHAVAEAARLNGPWSEPNPYEVVHNRAASDSQSHTLAAPSAMLSPGLPMSPRPGDRPPNSPMPRAPVTQMANSMPLSPRAGVALPLSPRAPRSAIPLPPQTPMALMSPHLDRAKAYAAQAPQFQALANLADRMKPMNGGSPDQGRPSMSSDQSSVHSPGEIYKGLQTEDYPDLLLPPNALPSIYVKTASSRMVRSRVSMLVSKAADENPVFTLAVHERSQHRELWRVEKTYQALSQLDYDIKALCRISDRIPDKTLFTGHAPAKIDARRMALNVYFERTMDCVTEEKAARIFCKFLSTEAFAPEKSDYFTSNEQNKRPDSPAVTPLRLRPNMAGYLTKRGKNFGGWKARYFVLDGPLFKYFEGPGGAHLGSIKLQNAQIGKQSANPNQNAHDDEDNQFRHAFLILEPKKKDSSALVRHVLCAESDAERDQWVDALLHYVDYREVEDRLQPARQAQVAKTELAARSPRLQKSMGDLRTATAFSQDAAAQAKVDLQSVGYNDTVAGNAPIMGPVTSRGGSDTPSPPHDKLATDQSYPTISGPTNLQVISDTENWGMKVPPTPGKDKKRSVFQLPFTRGRGSSDQEPKDAVNEHAYSTRAVFGASLADAVAYSQPAGVDTELPSVVYRCIEYLTARHAVAEEGIFRLSGSNVLIKALKDRFNTEGDVNLLEAHQNYDVHAVASLLKLYLRELPASILTRDLHLDFLHCLELPAEEKVPALNVLVNRLPRHNRALLEALSAFMLLIVNNVLVNKMNVRNRKSRVSSYVYTCVTNS